MKIFLCCPYSWVPLLITVHGSLLSHTVSHVVHGMDHPWRSYTFNPSRRSRIHDFDCFDMYTGGLETIAICHEKHFLVLVVLKTVTAESGIPDTKINYHCH